MTFLYVDLDAGLFFAEMAQSTTDLDRQRQLARRSQTVYETVDRLMAKVRMPTADLKRLERGLRTLAAEIAKLPA